MTVTGPTRRGLFAALLALLFPWRTVASTTIAPKPECIWVFGFCLAKPRREQTYCIVKRIQGFAFDTSGHVGLPPMPDFHGGIQRAIVRMSDGTCWLLSPCWHPVLPHCASLWEIAEEAA